MGFDDPLLRLRSIGDVQRLCIGLYRDAARMGLARYVRPGRIYFYCIRRDVYRLA